MAALVIGLSFMASRLLGLLRDRLLVAQFGVGPETDAYTAAFRLPELLFTLLVSGAFAVAFIPVFAEHLSKNDRKSAWEMSSVLLNFLLIFTAVAGVIAFIFAGPLTSLLAPGFNEYQHNLTVYLTRIMLITPMLFAVSSLLGSVAQSFGRFIIFALASVFYNLGIIFGIVFLSPTESIYGVAYGVVIGAFLQAVLQIGGLAGLGYRYHWSLKFRRNDVQRVVKLMVPRSLDQGIDQIHYIVETIIASRLQVGSLAIYYFANNLKNVPLVLIGNSVATAAFPTMAARAAKGAYETLIKEFVLNARLILFLVIPAAIVTVIMRGYIVRLLYGFGDPTTANTLGWFAGAIVFQALFFLVARMFYALQDSKTPLYVSLSAIAINVPLSFGLSHEFGVVGLAMAQSVLAVIEVVVLTVLLQRRMKQIGLHSIWAGLWRMLLSGAIMAGTTYILVARVAPLYLADTGFFVVAPKFFGILALSLAAYFIPCYLLDLHEARKVYGRLKEQILKPLNLT